MLIIEYGAAELDRQIKNIKLERHCRILRVFEISIDMDCRTSV